VQASSPAVSCEHISMTDELGMTVNDGKPGMTMGVALIVASTGAARACSAVTVTNEADPPIPANAIRTAMH
jgi:hypothetical protein